MRFGRTRLRSLSVPVVVLSGCALAAFSSPRSGAQTVRDGQQILARARAWSGGAAFEAVRSLSTTGTMEPRGESQHRYDVFILLPGSCQVRHEGGWVHTLDQSKFWMTTPPDFPGFTAEMQATADRGTRQTCVEATMALLLRPPEGLGVTLASVGTTAVEGLRGEGVRVALPGKEGNTFVFDPVDGRPLGYVTRRAASSSGSDEMDIALFSAYRTVSGSRFPSHIEIHYLPAGHIVDWDIGELRVNELKATDFRRDARGKSLVSGQ